MSSQDRVIARGTFPEEPGGRAIVVTASGAALQRDPARSIRELSEGGHPARWHPVRAGHTWLPILEEYAPTWPQVLAEGPVLVVWDPEGRDAGHAAALRDYAEGGAGVPA